MNPSTATSNHLKRTLPGDQAQARTLRTKFNKNLRYLPFALLSLLGLLSLSEKIFPGRVTTRNGISRLIDDWGQPGCVGDGLNHYLTDFTRDIVPIACHSHNDYWRRVPLFDAIKAGCISVEPDVWLIDGELLVGHDKSSLTSHRTFHSLYVGPLLQVLNHQNSETPYVSRSDHGVFDTDPSASLTLLVEFKSDGTAMLPFIESALSPLRDEGYLTHFNGSHRVERQITVVGTGNAPFDHLIANQSYRDIFFDAPLTLLDETSKLPFDERKAMLSQVRGADLGLDNVVSGKEFTPLNSHYASTDFVGAIGFPWRGYLTEAQIRHIRMQIKSAEKQGLKSRFWNTPLWPIGIRNHVWEVLVNEGTGMLNVDDLQGASRGDWRKTRWFG